MNLFRSNIGLKSFTGKEILRVLFASNIKPIGERSRPYDALSHAISVLIAFTNHALDHMLTSVLDANITTNVVRLGSRTTDERIEKLSLYNLEQRSGGGDLDRTIGREYRALKEVEEEVTRIMNRIQLPGLTWEDTKKFLDIHYPRHADSFKRPPSWIAELFRRDKEDEKKNGEWKKVTKGRKASRDVEIAGVYGFWKSGRDIEFIQPRPSSSKKASRRKGADTDPRVAFFNEIGWEGRIPSPPFTFRCRSLEELKGVDKVWWMSRPERLRVAESWEDDMRKIAYDSLQTDFERLRGRYKDACKDYEDIRDEVSRFSFLCCQV